MDGRKLEAARVEKAAAALPAVLARAGKNPLVVLESNVRVVYWAADVLEAAGAEMPLAHPLGVKAFSYRRVQNDERDAADLADLTRMGRLRRRGSARAQVRALREVVRGTGTSWSGSGPRARTRCMRYWPSAGSR